MAYRSRKSFLALIRGAWDATIGERKRLFLFTFLFVIANILNLLVPWAEGYALSAFVQGGLTDEAFYQVLLCVAAYTGLRLGYTLLHHSARYIQNRVAYSARMNALGNVFDALMDFPLRWHVDHHSGENLSKLHRTAGAIDSMIGTYIWQLIEGSVKIVFAGVAIFALDFWVATDVLVMALLTIATMVFFNKKLVVRIRRNNIFMNKLNRICLDYLSNIVTVKTLGIEQAARKQLRSQKKEGVGLSQAIAAYMELKWSVTGIGYALVIGTALIIYFYGHHRSKEPIDVAHVYVLLNYLNQIFQAIGSFTGYYSGLIESSTAFEDATQISEEIQALPDRHSDTRLDPTWRTVYVRDLSFSYITGEAVGLNKATFEVKRGEKIALVGHSGSGKSTLLKIFGGLILPDGYALSNDTQEGLTFDDLLPSCLLLPQEPEVFSESIQYNLTMGEEFDTREMSFFVSLCKLDPVIAKLRFGLQTSLAEKGLNLSVGEKQRVALARGLIRAGKKDILLFDEPTSSLDPKTEKEIFLGMLYHFASRTVISSSHRLNLVPLFDRIIMLSSGQIVEMGTFAELIEKKSHFYKIWDDYQRNMAQEGSLSEAVRETE